MQLVPSNTISPKDQFKDHLKFELKYKICYEKKKRNYDMKPRGLMGGPPICFAPPILFFNKHNKRGGEKNNKNSGHLSCICWYIRFGQTKMLLHQWSYTKGFSILDHIQACLLFSLKIHSFWKVLFKLSVIKIIKKIHWI